ncbi:methyltransferase [uncultured Umboniibacter sp.]|uniref:methyltransferase n=1 Tax=uncultured Umboniibacter sp. TaxID=1798917 RepID=UPI00261EB9B2|nr:methyltransferase [uncultured Umboniibacter sp.]
MTDPAIELLTPFITGDTVLIADEHWTLEDCKVPRLCITNRFRANAPKSISFSDFENRTEEQFSRIVYRLSKERAVVYRCLNLAAELLRIDGQLIIAGGNKEGIKTALKQAKLLFGTEIETTIHSGYRLAIITKVKATTGIDDNDYQQLREVTTKTQSFWSKPGLFGWDKVDRGSEILVDVINEQLNGSVLDLGCGWGFLSRAALQQNIDTLTATDNNAAAIIVAAKNLAPWTEQVNIIADDCGESLAANQFDHILCNPPFHQGFDHQTQLTEKFINQCARLAKPEGTVWWVVNQFVGVSQLAQKTFSQRDHIERRDGFDIWRLRAPKW